MYAEVQATSGPGSEDLSTQVQWEDVATCVMPPEDPDSDFAVTLMHLDVLLTAAPVRRPEREGISTQPPQYKDFANPAPRRVRPPRARGLKDANLDLSAK
jgi:hypothetical protein